MYSRMLILFLLTISVITITSKKTEDGGAKAKSGKASSGTLSSKVVDVSSDQLAKLIEDNEYLLVFFYDDDPSKVQFSKQVG